MTEGLTEGQHEPTSKHGRSVPGEEDKTTAIVVAGQPRHELADRQSDREVEVRPRVILLGSSELSRELTIALRHLGAEVTAVDGYADAPAHGVADQSLVVSMTDADELSAVFARLQPDFVVTVADAVSVDALEALNAPDAQAENELTELVPSARSVRLTADREGVRRLAAGELGLPTAPFWFVGSVGELEAVAAYAGFPLLVKPAFGAPGQGHSVVAGSDDIAAAWRHAVGREEGMARQRAMAEAVVEIEFHITLIVVRTDGPNGPVIAFCAPIGHSDADAQVLESWQPQQMSTAALDAAKSIAARIVKALGGRGVFSVELMINGDEVYFVDVTPYPRETAWVTLRSQRLSAFELQARAILGLALDTMMISPAAARVVGAVPAADTLTDALAVPESDVRVFGRAGQLALATAPDVATARDRARQVATALHMRDSRG